MDVMRGLVVKGDRIALHFRSFNNAVLIMHLINLDSYPNLIYNQFQ